MLDMAPLPGVTFIKGDFREDDVLAELEKALDGKRADLVISDMAPNLTGIRVSDQAHGMYLAELALAFCREHLNPGKNFLVKVFQEVTLKHSGNQCRLILQRSSSGNQRLREIVVKSYIYWDWKK